MGRLEGKAAVITGAAGGQGAAAARRFVAEGARVLIADVADGQGIAEELGDRAMYRKLDVGDPHAWTEAVAAAEGAFGKVDVLVNNAGVLHFSAFEDTSLEDYERVIRVNQTGTFLGIRAVIPAMRRAGGGSIVNVSSVEGIAGMPFVAPYSASKFAIRGLTKVAAMELGAHGIRVNSVHPGVIDTQMVRGAAGDDEMDLSFVGKLVALGRVGQPEEMAGLVIFLASDESSYCTGSEFVADGGATATHSLAQH